MSKKEDGVWRTIGGRHIFIKDGQSVSEAMKSSGKFPSAKKNKKEKTKDTTIIKDENKYLVDGKETSESEMKAEWSKEHKKGNVEEDYETWKKNVVDDRNSNVKSTNKQIDRDGMMEVLDEWSNEGFEEGHYERNSAGRGVFHERYASGHLENYGGRDDDFILKGFDRGSVGDDDALSELNKKLNKHGYEAKYEGDYNSNIRISKKKSWQEEQNKQIINNAKSAFNMTKEQEEEFNKFLNKMHAKAPEIKNNDNLSNKEIAKKHQQYINRTASARSINDLQDIAEELHNDKDINNDVYYAISKDIQSGKSLNDIRYNMESYLQEHNSQMQKSASSEGQQVRNKINEVADRTEKKGYNAMLEYTDDGDGYSVLQNKVFRQAYNEYMKEHPNSKLTFEKFKKYMEE